MTSLTFRVRLIGVVAAVGSAIALGVPAVAQEREPCEYLKLLVSGFTSGDVHTYDACDGTHLSNFDVASVLSGVQAIVRGPDGNLYVASEQNDRVVRYNWQTGALIDNFVVDDPGTPAEDETGGLDAPTGIAFGPNGSLFVASFSNNNVLEYSGTTGAFLGEFVSPGLGGLDGPDAGMVFGADGHLYIPSFNSSRVLIYNGTNGALIGDAATSGLSNPRVVLFTEQNTMLVTSWGNGRIIEYNPQTGSLIRIVATIQRPTGMAFGPKGFLHVTSDSSDRVVVFDVATGDNLGALVPTGSGGLDGGTFVFFWGDLPAPIPTVSDWGLLTTALILMVIGTVLLRRERSPGWKSA